MEIKTYETKLKEKKEEVRTFKENTSLGLIQDKLAELELRLEELEK